MSTWGGIEKDRCRKSLRGGVDTSSLFQLSLNLRAPGLGRAKTDLHVSAPWVGKVGDTSDKKGESGGVNINSLHPSLTHFILISNGTVPLWMHSPLTTLRVDELPHELPLSILYPPR